MLEIAFPVGRDKEEPATGARTVDYIHDRPAQMRKPPVEAHIAQIAIEQAEPNKLSAALNRLFSMEEFLVREQKRRNAALA
jgi:hypothetical protein